MKRKRRTQESGETEKQQKPNPCNDRSSFVGEEGLINADSGSSSLDEESCDEDIGISEGPVCSDPQRPPTATVITSRDSTHNSMPSPAYGMADAPSMVSLYEGIVDEGLLNDIPELELHTWTLEGGSLGADHNPLNTSNDVSEQLGLNKIDVQGDNGDMPLALGSHNEEHGLLHQQQAYSLPKSAVGEDVSTICYPDAPLESLLPENESGSVSPERITLTLHNPSSDTIASLIQVAVSSNSPFRFKRH
jgi:hypothetical protein